MRLSLVLNWICPIFSFLERFQPIATITCTIAIYVLKPGAFNAISIFLYSYLIKFHDFVDHIQEGMKHQMGDATQLNKAWLSR